MRYLFLLLLLVFLQTSFLQVFFRPGFVAPDLLLVTLVSRVYLKGREAVLWSVLGGALLDVMTDTLGLNLALETLAVYTFVIFTQKLFLRTWFTYLMGAGFVFLMKKVLSLVLMRTKFSFTVSPLSLFLSLVIEVCLAVFVYLLYLKKRE